MATQSVELGRAWDDVFSGWTEELLLGRKYQKPRRAPAARSSWTGASLAPNAVPDYAGKGSKADVSARLFALAQGGRQVMIKITGASKTVKAMKLHMDYLSREGELALTDQDGNPAQGDEALKALAWEWEYSGPKLDDSADRKEAFHIVFSMPEGTDARALAAAVRATAAVEFAGHQWAMVQHFDEPHVHAHLLVKAEALDGRRLNPRKADLQRWRERFAHELRERGVEAEATRRIARLRQTKIAKPWAVTRLEERGLPTNARTAPDPAKVNAWNASSQRTVTTHGKIIDALARSADAHDRALAQKMANLLIERTKATPVPERKAPELER